MSYEREELAGALAGFVGLDPGEHIECWGSELLPIIQAAEKWYDQLPVKCAHGRDKGHYVVPDLPLSFPDAPWCPGLKSDQVGEPG